MPFCDDLGIFGSYERFREDEDRKIAGGKRKRAKKDVHKMVQLLFDPSKY